MGGAMGRAIKYLYWSERKVAALADDNSINFGPGFLTEFELGVAGARARRATAPKVPTRHDKALVIERALDGLVVTDLVTPPRARYVAGGGRVVCSHFQLAGGDRVVMFAEMPAGDGPPAAICLFGRMGNFPDFLEEVDSPRQRGWVSSSARSVEAFIKDRALPERVSNGEEDAYMAREAFTIAYCQGLNGNGNRPSAYDPRERAYTFTEFEDSSWLAEVYLDVDMIAEGLSPEEGYTRIVVASPLWVRTPNLKTFRLYEEEDEQQSPHHVDEAVDSSSGPRWLRWLMGRTN